MTRLNIWKKPLAIFFFCTVAAIASLAQTFTTLVNFDGKHGSGPAGSLIQGTDGNFYGTTMSGGADDGGTVFKVTPLGRLTILYSFGYGRGPEAGLVQATDGYFYGTSGNIIFRITASGKLSTLYTFCSQANCTDGESPLGLVQAVDGNFYGITFQGGANGQGTAFKITPTGLLTTLYSFCSQLNCSDGKLPAAALVQGVDGSIYGTTTEGGAYGGGTIFRIKQAGELTTVYNFCSRSNCSDGQFPAAALVRGVGGSFYGTTQGGGANGYGAVFKITPSGELTTLYSFCSQTNCTDGELPEASLVQGSDGNFYGTAEAGGEFQSCFVGFCGTVFRVTPRGELTTLQSFDGSDGSSPIAGLLQGTDGNFYGTTSLGGDAYGYGGTVFSLSLGLGSFISLPRDSGKVGQTGIILGQGFTGTTGVFVNGTPASFTVVSDTFIRAIVPPGATTGFVTVQTPGGTLTSNVPFRVVP